jgi:FtsP/CotA-like multicopper oxidase with cupredoxin domain
MPGGEVISMWGLALDNGFEGTELEAAAVPGPEIRASEGDTLVIHLDNNLPAGLAHPTAVSMVVPGQLATMSPVYFTDGQGRQRVQSFTHETSVGNATEVTYTWTNLKPGTYLYQSGTHPAVQVQMGLYGALVVESATIGQAYDDAFSAYDEEAVLLYSEIDRELHAAVAAGDYGPGLAMSSTIDYQPEYFLVNGLPYPDTPALSPGAEGNSVLIRILNAGLKTHVPVILNQRWSVIAEDGNPYVYARDQASLWLPAGQTRDAIVSVPVPGAGSYPIYDHSLGLSNAGDSPGGMLTFLEVGP